MQYIRRKNLMGRYDLYLDMGDVSLPHAEKLDDWQIFPIRTYTKVSNNDHGDLWDINFRVVNSFFEHISNADAAEIGMMLIEMNYTIAQFMQSEDLKTDLPKLLNTLATMLYELDVQIDLYNKLVTYCKFEIPLGDLSGAGKRAQDTEELTFYAQDVVQLLGVVVLSKLMAPIFGTLMYYLVDRNVESKLKEPHCVSILRKLFDRCCPTLITKLQFYIRHGIKNEFEEDMTAIYHGLTSNSLHNQIFSTLLTRNFVNVDLYRKNGKLMVFVNVSIKKTISTQKHNMNQNMVRVRCDMSGEMGDENKKSHLEIDSVVSTKTADIPILISAGLDRTIHSFLAEHDIPMQEFNNCLGYYRKHPVLVHGLNKFFLQTFIGTYIGGAKSLALLGSADVAKIITLLQMICISLGYRELGHMLSCHQGNLVKSDSSDQDQMMRVTYKNSVQYRNYRAKLETSPINAKQATKRFDSIMLEIVEAASQQVFIYNTAPFIWESIEESPAYNGKAIQFSDNLVPSICAVISLATQV